MSQSKSFLSILCLVLAYSCAQAWNMAEDNGERTVKDSEFRYIVTVSSKTEIPSYIGGGSLISNSVVLTSCKGIKDHSAGELEVFINEWDDSIYEEKRSVRSVVRHPNFSKKSGASNLALLFLKEPVEFSSKISPIKLATQTSLRKLDLTRCIAKSLHMQTLPLPVWSTESCNEKLQTWLGASFLLDDSLICAGGGIGRNICDDDGYPLVCPVARDPSQFEQVGIINWHIDCEKRNTPDVYTSVFRFDEWINRQISLNSYVEDSSEVDDFLYLMYDMD